MLKIAFIFSLADGASSKFQLFVLSLGTKITSKIDWF